MYNQIVRKFIESAEEGIGPTIPPATAPNASLGFGEPQDGIREIGAKSKPFKGKMKYGWRKTTERFSLVGSASVFIWVDIIIYFYFTCKVFRTFIRWKV